MSISPNLNLPYIYAAQAQKHVTHNEAISALDAIVQLCVLDRDLAAPPDSPDNGDRYIVPHVATGDWSGQDGKVAAFQDDGWVYFAPSNGWLAWVTDEDKIVVWNGASWEPLVADVATSTSLLGINATADTTNRLAVASAATLFSHDGSGHQLKLNKATAGDTASLLFQTDWSGRAEMGTTGDNNFHIKVSPDGSTWHDSIAIGSDGAVSLATLKIAQGSGALVERSSSQSLNNINYRTIVNRNLYDDGSGAAGEDYANEVVACGWNLSETVGVAETDIAPAIWDSVEYKYHVASSGRYYHERHMESLDTDSERHRFFSFAIPHDGGGGSSHQIAIDKIVWRVFDESRVGVEWHLLDGHAYVGSASHSFHFRFQANNAPVLRQRNSTNDAWLNLPYFDASNRLVLSGRQINNPGAIPGGNDGIQYNWNSGEVPNGTCCFSVTTNTQTDSEFYAFFAGGATNWRIKTGIRNSHASGIAQSELIANGPAFYRATDYTNDWSFGKNGAGDFFVGRGDPGSDTVLAVDKSRLALELARPPKLPSYSVAGLPSASTYGAGSMVFVGDETGGSVVAFSDGTDWRRMTDRAVVS